MTFRRPNDNQKLRKMSTPTSDELMQNMSALIEKWQSIIPAEATKEMKQLKKHIAKGCLDLIPPGAGTSANENCHKHLNAFLGKKYVLSLDTAIALMNIFFYERNTRIAKNKNATVHKVTQQEPKSADMPHMDYQAVGLSQNPEAPSTSTPGHVHATRDQINDVSVRCMSFISIVDNFTISSNSLNCTNIMFDFCASQEGIKITVNEETTPAMLEARLQIFSKRLHGSSAKLEQAFLNTIISNDNLVSSVLTHLKVYTIDNQLFGEQLASAAAKMGYDLRQVKAFQESLVSDNPHSNEELHKTLQILANASGHCIILTSPCTAQDYNTFHPIPDTFAQNVIVLGLNGGLFFSTCNNSEDNIEIVTCQCGYQNKSESSCQSIRCQCFSNGRNCNSCKCKGNNQTVEVKILSYKVIKSQGNILLTRSYPDKQLQLS
jgi:hypothetical protein